MHLTVSFRDSPALQLRHESGEVVAAVPLVAEGVEHHQAGGIQLRDSGVLQEPSYILGGEG